MIKNLMQDEQTASIQLVAFIDVLGFTAALKKDANFDTLLRLLKAFVAKKRNYLEKQTNATHEENKSYNIQPSITAFSDSVVISYSLEGVLPPIGIISQLGDDIASIALHALDYGFLIRGSIAEGKLYHYNGIILGIPFVEAYELEKKGTMPRISIPEELAKRYNLDKPPKFSKSGGPFIEAPDCMFLLAEHQENSSFYSVNYIRQMLSYGIMPGDSWWNNLKIRVDKFRIIIQKNILAINSDETLTYEKRNDILSKWEWFSNQLEKEVGKLFRLFENPSKSAPTLTS